MRGKKTRPLLLTDRSGSPATPRVCECGCVCACVCVCVRGIESASRRIEVGERNQIRCLLFWG